MLPAGRLPGPLASRFQVTSGAVREQAKSLLFEEGSLELGCSRGLDLPTLPGDVRGRRRASGRQAEAVAAGKRNNTGGHQESPAPLTSLEGGVS